MWRVLLLGVLLGAGCEDDPPPTIQLTLDSVEADGDSVSFDLGTTALGAPHDVSGTLLAKVVDGDDSVLCSYEGPISTDAGHARVEARFGTPCTPAGGDTADVALTVELRYEGGAMATAIVPGRQLPTQLMESIRPQAEVAEHRETGDDSEADPAEETLVPITVEALGVAIDAPEGARVLPPRPNTNPAHRVTLGASERSVGIVPVERPMTVEVYVENTTELGGGEILWQREEEGGWSASARMGAQVGGGYATVVYREIGGRSFTCRPSEPVQDETTLHRIERICGTLRAAP